MSVVNGQNGHANGFISRRLWMACSALSLTFALMGAGMGYLLLPEQSPERIAGRIVVPHPPMPQIEVTRNEIRDLAAYIMSLKGQ